PGQGAPSAEPRRAGVAKAVLGRGGLRATGGKTVQLRLSCSADGPCAGTVKLLAAGQKLGARRFALAAGGRGSFALQLRRPARSLLTGAPEVGVKVLVRSRQADGSAVVRSARTQLKGEVTPPPAPRGGSGGTP
ncbi:MAG TPA: hypothetical protein VGV34_07050, partial [Solirubrobacterales bacterium]|nr:hypothetical protein [Solirubrobacterales bacterium]